eukprot:scaffold3079_cov237-Chaetoceros_neogracile.AAC.7
MTGRVYAADDVPRYPLILFAIIQSCQRLFLIQGFQIIASSRAGVLPYNKLNDSDSSEFLFDMCIHSSCRCNVDLHAIKRDI